MQKVRVIAPMGAPLRGPVTVKLSKEQHLPRAHVLGKARHGGVYDLAGDQVLTFKLSEVLGVEKPVGRLNMSLFELVEGSVEEEAKAGSAAAVGRLTP
jgi:hypothetical protein